MEIDKEFRTKEFQNTRIVIFIADSTDTVNSPQVNRHLTYLTMIYRFYNDGIITEKHVITFYDRYVRGCNKNKIVREHIEKHKEKFSELYE